MPSREAKSAFRSHSPEPGRFWVAASPKVWPTAPRCWVGVADGKLREGAGSAEPALRGEISAQRAFEALASERLEDVLYLPPLPSELRTGRDAVVQAHRRRGTPVIVQETLGGGDQPPAVAGPEDAAEEAAPIVYDLLPSILDGRLDAISGAVPGSWALWPLISGVTSDQGLWDEVCGELAAAGAGGLLAMTPELTPAQRRSLAERVDDSAFHALFHQSPPAERALARIAARHGLAPFPDRPLPAAPLRGATNRRLGGVLIAVADLWQRLDRPMGKEQAFYRAARWIDQTPYDVEALRREGNLEVVEPLEAPSLDLIEEVLDTGGCALLRELTEEWCS